MRRSRTGFSLIEALVVLAIGGMALAIVFSIGTKAGDSGFALGRRAMAAADADISVSDLRTVIQSFALRPPAMAQTGLDTPVTGEPDRLEGPVVMKRATPCAPQGWAGQLSLVLEDRDGGQALVCRAGARTVTLMAVPAGRAGFTFSSDGREWDSRYSSDPTAFADPSQLRYLRLFVRLDAPGQIDVLDGVTSGPMQRWTRESEFGG
ncbi:prepilin-type N-terminal cleavage/methylation domain-containing protein [Brevundimonas staleyi]|uniref:Prepilin-type N-terminal cleavage/methylation domain-containing protein n=1 Tax=Brevundimonas staleyi TaxID=74326 RepID=A0ABW0FQI9_9CAUL